MEWEKKFEIGCEIVDSQHKELVGLVTQFENSPKAGVSGQQLADILRFLVGYTRYHFCAEEAFMKSIDFPQLDEHHRIHDDLIQKVTDILLALKKGETLDPQNLYLFLVDWVKNHVLEEDMKIGKFYRNTRKETPEMVKEKALVDERKLFITRFLKLKDLFLKKLISNEDFTEHKLKIVVALFEKRGLNRLREFFTDVDLLIKSDFITDKDKEEVALKIFQNMELQKTISQIPDLEGRLFLLRTYQTFELASDEIIDDEKMKILQEL